MDLELGEMQRTNMPENGTPGVSTPTEPTGVRPPSPVDSIYEEECARYDEVREVTESGNGLKLEALLGQWQEKGWLRDWRNDEELTLYADAITDGYLDIITVLLSFDVPVGDALIRAIDVEFDDAIKAICRYAEGQEDIRESILTGVCDNDDFHPAITPLILASQRNNFGTVKLLVELGAEITEPTLSQGGDVTLTQAISTLHVYRALSQPAYILATKTDIFGHAFEMSAKLKTLSRTWQDFGAEYERMAGGVEVFAGEMLGQSSSTEEILALFRFHNTDKYRDVEGKQHPLAKLFEAIKYQQKEFIAHPHSQKAIIVQFYRNLLDWNERGLLYRILLMFFVLFGYPIICVLYIFVPVRKVVEFVRLPYIMMMMKAGSGFTFLAIIVAVTVLGKHSYPRTVESLHTVLLIWIIGLAWMHIKLIRKHGLVQYLSYSVNLHELVMIGLYLTAFILQWNGASKMSEDGNLRRSVRQANLDNVTSLDLQNHIASALGGLSGRLNNTVIDGVNGILLKTMSNCQPRGAVETPTGSLVPAAGVPFQNHLPQLQETIEKDQFEPTVVAEALFGVAITVSVLRMLNLLLISDSVGPLRISFGAMVADIVKFLGIFMFIWFAFAIGLFQNFYSAAHSATRACIGEGNEPDSCQFLVGFSTFLESMKDLYWSLYGLTEIDILVLPGKHSVAEGVGTFLYVGYLIVAVLVLLNALIGMLSNTYNLTEEHADTEWKFHRAAVWATYLRPVGTLPPPFNLIPSIKTLYRLFTCCTAARRSVVSRKEVHFEKELEDYRRVLKLVSTRYIQANLSTESQNNENARPRDLQTLRNDILAFKFNVQDRLDNISKTLGLTNDKTTTVHRKLDDLDPLNDKTGNVLDESSSLKDNLVILFDETDDLQQTQETEITVRDQDVSQLRETVAKLRANIEELNTGQSAEIARRDQQEASMTNTIHGLQEDKTSLTNTVCGLAEDKTQLTRQVGELQEDALISEREISELEDTIGALRDEVKQLKTSHSAEMTERNRQQEEQNETIRELQEESKGLKDTIDTLDKDKAELTKKVEELRKETDALQQQPSSLKYTIAAHRVEIEKLSGSHSVEITEKEQQEAKLNNTIHELQEENLALTDNVRLIKEEKTELAIKLSELTEGTDGLERESSEMRDAMAALQDELEELKSRHSADVKVRDQEDDELKNTIRNLREEKTCLKDTVREHGEAKAELTRALSKLSNETDILVRESSKKKDEMSALIGEIEELRSSHSTELTVRDQKEAKLNDTIRGLHEANKGLTNEVQDLGKDKVDLTRKVSKFSEGTDMLEKNSSELRDKMAGLQSEIKQLKTNHSAELAKIDRENTKLKDTLRRLEEDKSGLKDTIHGLDKDKENLTGKVSELTAVTTVLERDSSELKNTIAALRIEMEQLRSTHSAELVERNRQDAELMNTNRSLQEEKKGLENTLSGLKEDKAELTRLVGELNREIIKSRRPKETKPVPKQASPIEEPNEPDQSQLSMFRRISNVIGETFATKREGANADDN